MSIEFAVKSLQSFIRDIRAEARAVSHGEKPRGLPQKNTLRVYLRSQDEVDEAHRIMAIQERSHE